MTDVTIPENEKKVIAVLTFEDLTIGNKKFRAWGRGIPDQVMARLSVIPFFRVVAREHFLGKLLEERAFQMTGVTDQAGTVRVGRMLNARYMVNGSFQVFGQTLQVIASVIDVETGQVMHTASVKGEYLKFFEIQNQVAIRIAEGLKIDLSLQEKEKLLSAVDTRIVDASLANYEGEDRLESIIILKYRNKTGQVSVLKEEAKRLFSDALKLDSQYERAKLNLKKLAHAVPMTL